MATSAAPVAAIQRSAGIVRIHSISAKPASSGGAKAIPQPSRYANTSCQGLTMAPAFGANSAMVLTIASSTSNSASASLAARPLMRKLLVERRRRVVRRRVERRLLTGSSYLHHDRHDHRSPLGALVEEPGER